MIVEVGASTIGHAHNRRPTGSQHTLIGNISWIPLVAVCAFFFNRRRKAIMKPLRSPINWFGGKSHFRAKLYPLLPDHTAYVEPFGGGDACSLGKNRPKSKSTTTLTKACITFSRCLQTRFCSRTSGRASPCSPTAANSTATASARGAIAKTPLIAL